MTRPYQTAHVTIADPTTLKVEATGAAAGDPYDGAFSGLFVDEQSQPVAISAGDRLTADIASDAAWVVPDIDATASAGTDIVSGRCFDTGRSEELAQIRLFRNGVRRGWAVTWTDQDGYFVLDFRDPEVWFPDPAVIKSGDRILVSCLQTNGDYVQKSFFVP